MERVLEIEALVGNWQQSGRTKLLMDADLVARDPRLALAGTEVHYREAKGMIHGFMRARFTGSAARAEYEAICGFLRERLA